MRTNTARRRVTLLVHALFAAELGGVVLTVVSAVSVDQYLATWKSPLLLFALLSVTIGWVLAWRRPLVPIGWLMLGFGFIGSLQGPATLIAFQIYRDHPVAAGWLLEIGTESTWTWIPSLGILLGLIPLRFPTGDLPSGRWRWVWRLSVAVIVAGSLFATTPSPSMVSAEMVKHLHFAPPNPTYVAWPAPVLSAITIGLELCLLAMLIGAVASLFVRYRHGGVIERAQLRWLFWAVSVIVVLLIGSNVENILFGDEDSKNTTAALTADVLDVINSLAYCLIPIAIMIAVLRSGLYTIDRLVSRTATYAAVSVTVIAVYVSLVLLGSMLFPQLKDQGVAVATLAAAALFFPLLRLLRRGIDRRFNREQYDAQKIVDAFGERVRSGVDPFVIGDDLAAAVQLALQPSSIGIWVREQAGS